MFNCLKVGDLWRFFLVLNVTVIHEAILRIRKAKVIS